MTTEREAGDDLTPEQGALVEDAFDKWDREAGKVKRYEPAIVGLPDEGLPQQIRLALHPVGSVVKYEDHAAALAEARREVERLREQVAMADSMVGASRTWGGMGWVYHDMAPFRVMKLAVALGYPDDKTSHGVAEQWKARAKSAESSRDEWRARAERAEAVVQQIVDRVELSRHDAISQGRIGAGNVLSEVAELLMDAQKLAASESGEGEGGQ